MDTNTGRKNTTLNNNIITKTNLNPFLKDNKMFN